MGRSNLWKVTTLDVFSYGVEVEDIIGIRDWPETNTPSIIVPGNDGAYVGDDDVTDTITMPRRFRIIGAVDGRSSTLQTRLDAFADLLERGNISHEFPQIRSNVLYTARLDGPRPFVGIAPSQRNKAVRFDLPFFAKQPYGVDASSTIVTGASGSPLSCPMGTAKCDVSVVITANGGAIGDPILIHKNAAGVELSRIELTTLGAANRKYRIDTTNGGHVEVDNGSGYVNGMALIQNSDSYDFPNLLPDYGTRGGTSQSLTVTVTSGTADVAITYYKRWR